MSIINRIKEKLSKYLDVHIRLFKINFIGRTANLLSYFMFALIGMFIFFCIILFLGLGLSEAFVAAGLSKTSSFFLTTGIYFLLLFVAVLLRRNITRFFASAFIRVLTEGDDDDDKKVDNDEEEEVKE